MAHGLPALGTRTGGIPGLISDGVNGYLVASDDPGALVERIAQLIEDRELLARLGLGALARFKEFPAWDASTERVRDFLSSLVLN
jgi:glycosyltransferase involved in cell wall biosynthesis